jgi:hypothetical protein
VHRDSKRQFEGQGLYSQRTLTPKIKTKLFLLYTQLNASMSQVRMKSLSHAPLLADLFLHSYEAEFVQKLLRDNNKKTSRVLQPYIQIYR